MTSHRENYGAKLIALLSMHTAQYSELASITGAQKRLYCEKRKFCWSDPEVLWNPKLGFTKFQLIKAIWEANPHIEWIWFTGADVLITDFTNDLSSIVNTEKSFIITTDRNGYNADSFFIRNTLTGRDMLQWLMTAEPLFPDEQGAITCYLDTIGISTGHCEIAPQRTFNSYDYHLYPGPDSNKDRFGNVGQWHYGDLCIHWPGFSDNPEMRVRWANEYLASNKVKYGEP